MNCFVKKIESVQYKACLAITGAIQGTSQEKLYQELGLESLSDRRWYRKLIFFYKIKNKITPAYLNSYLYNNNNTNRTYCTRSSQNETLRTFSSRTESFKHSFFPYCIKEWNKLDNIIRKAESLGKFKSLLLSFIRVKSRSVFSIHDPIGIKLLTRLRLGFSHLNEHKFRHNFRDTVSAMCDCGSEIESTQHFLLRYPITNDEGKNSLKVFMTKNHLF